MCGCPCRILMTLSVCSSPAETVDIHLVSPRGLSSTSLVIGPPLDGKAVRAKGNAMFHSFSSVCGLHRQLVREWLPPFGYGGFALYIYRERERYIYLSLYIYDVPLHDFLHYLALTNWLYLHT